MFRGSIVALVTPFHQGQVDVSALENLIEFHIQEGTNAIVVAGTTGESATLTDAEKSLIIKVAVKQARERIPIIAGTADNSTQRCVTLTKMAMELGAHAALIMTPAYIKPTQEGLYQHYKQIAETVAIPIILYNVPSRTACDLLPETVKRLAKFSNIIGIKEAGGDLQRFHDLYDSNEALEIYSGDDVTAAEWLLAGAKGVISVTANVAPHMMAKLCDAAFVKEESLCWHLNDKLKILHSLMFKETNPIPVKYALSKLGLIHDELRLPLTSLSSLHRETITQALMRLNLIQTGKS